MSHEHKHSNHSEKHNAAEENAEKNLENETENQEIGNEFEKEIASLKEKISDLEIVISEQNNKILRSLAEIENLRRRAAEDVEKTSKYAISKFAGDLVLAVENLYLAVDNMPEDEINGSEKLGNFAKGITMTQKELIKIFEKNGIKRINPINEKFDHNFHEAIARVECDQESGTITKVIQAGYTVHDRLIRPALVEVAG